MADLIPAASSALPVRPGNPLALLTDPAGGPIVSRLADFMAQPAVRKALPAFIGVAAIGGAALAWSALSPSPQRTLYSHLDDAERASVAAALDQAAIGYTIDNATGTLSVSESDFYKARMLVASDGALATPETDDAMLDSLPLGASRTLEGSRLRSARERDLQLTIMEIDGVEAVRVHLAEAEKSVFVRDNLPPSASVMVRLARGRQLSDGQVEAIVNLVAASVPGMSPEAVRVIDQHGRLFTQSHGSGAERLDLQSRMEDKLRRQIAQLLRPMLGEGNFTSEVQVELDMDEVTSARERYDKDGVVRTESQAQSRSTGTAPAIGVPGVLSNTPPLPTQAVQGAPRGTIPTGQPAQTNGESSSKRTYELGREVSVAETRPGGLRRVSVAVAISKDAVKGAAALKDIEGLVSAAVGASPDRGDQVKVITRTFEAADEAAIPFYEAGWFMPLLRYGAALLAVLLVLLLAVRPALKAVRSSAPTTTMPTDGPLTTSGEDDGADMAASSGAASSGASSSIADLPRNDLLQRQVGVAQRLVSEQPESALLAIRQMLQPDATAEKAA